MFSATTESFVTRDTNYRTVVEKATKELKASNVDTHHCFQLTFMIAVLSLSYERSCRYSDFVEFILPHGLHLHEARKQQICALADYVPVLLLWQENAFVFYC